MAVRVNFEIGHKASIRTKRTPEGFTHDWEVFVRGHEDANISHFIEKVVFHLHETFPKPKREVKKPPYTIKESGYGGFTLPIDIYLKNKDEPKKIKFSYELSLQDSGHMKDRYIFQNPNDEFKKKLLKGGGILVNNHQVYSNPEQDRSRDSFHDDKSQLFSKPKLSSEMKKHKVKESKDDLPKPSSTFQNLFGSPIHKPAKIIPETKKVLVPDSVSAPPGVLKPEKKDKDKSLNEKEKKSKYEYKDKVDKAKNKEEKDKAKEERTKIYQKESEKSKDKALHKRQNLPERAPSPPSKKQRISSPKRSNSPGNLSTSSMNDDIKPNKINMDQAEIKKNKIDEKSPEAKEKKKKDKKSHDKDKEYSKREHKKESAKAKEDDYNKEVVKQKEISREITRVSPKEKKSEKLFNKFSIDNFKAPAETHTQKLPDEMKPKEKPEGERKHKHKKKDKKRDESHERHKEKDREKKHKHEKKIKEFDEQKSYASDKPPEQPLLKDRFLPKEQAKEESGSPISIDTSSQASSKSTRSKLFNSMGVEDITSSSNSDSDDSLSFGCDKTKEKSDSKLLSPVKVEVRSPTPKLVPQLSFSSDNALEENSPGPSMKQKKKHKDKSKSKEERKIKKRKYSSKKEDEENKIAKTGETSKMQSEGKVKSETKVQDNGVSSSLGEEGPNSAPSSPEPKVERVESPQQAELSPEYLTRLQELQQRIMNIKSNDELERVVNLIAETGRFEVTTHSFDFDLCLLDKSTVQRLIQLIGC